MKLEKKFIINDNNRIKQLKNFYELKCNLPGKIIVGIFVVSKDLYPENVNSVTTEYDKGHLTLNMFFDTDFGLYLTFSVIDLHNGKVTTQFYPRYFKGEEIDNEVKLYPLNTEQTEKLIDFCLPSIDKFLKTISKLKRNYPCSKDCFYKNKKGKNGKCDKMYISQTEYTPEKDKMRQQIALGIKGKK